MLYVNLRPCFQCLAITRAAGVRSIIFDEDWAYSQEFEHIYRALSAEFDFFGSIEESGAPGPDATRSLLVP